MSFASLLNETCSVLTVTQATVAASGYGAASSYATTTNVPCRIQQGGSTEALEFQKITGRRSYTGFFAYGTGPQKTGDRVTWRGRTLQCVGFPSDRAGDQHHEETVLAEPADG